MLYWVNSKNTSFDSSMDPRNALFDSLELFPKDEVKKVVEKSSKVLHDEAIHKEVA